MGPLPALTVYSECSGEIMLPPLLYLQNSASLALLQSLLLEHTPAGFTGEAVQLSIERG